MRLSRFAASFAGALLLATCAGGPAFADYKEALDLIRKGDQAGGFVQMRAAAESGNTEAQFLAGQMMTQGVGTVRDPISALAMFDKAAAGGHVGAMSMAGTMYAYGDGVAINYGKAFPLLKKAAEAGDMHAQNNLAVLYHFGLGTEVDEAKALGWVLRAETLGLAAATSLRKEIEAAASPSEKAEGERLADHPLAGTVGAVAQNAHKPPPLPGGHAASTIFPDPKPPVAMNDGGARAEAPKPALSAAARKQIAKDAAAARGAARPIELVPEPAAPVAAAEPAKLAEPVREASVQPPAPVAAPAPAPVAPPPAAATEVTVPVTPAAPPAAQAPTQQAAVAPPAPPAPAPAPQAPAHAPAAPTAGGGFAVQIASLPNGQNVEQQWRALTVRHAAELDGQMHQFVPVDLGAKGQFTRILVGSFADRKSAMALCDRFKRAGLECLVQKF